MKVKHALIKEAMQWARNERSFINTEHKNEVLDLTDESVSQKISALPFSVTMSAVGIN
jgi:hypothetical protein